MNIRIRSIAAAAALSIAALGTAAPASAAGFGPLGQSLASQSDSLVIEVGHKGKKWKGKKWKKHWHKGFHIQLGYPGYGYPHWCFQEVLVKTKYGYVYKTVNTCH